MTRSGGGLARRVAALVVVALASVACSRAIEPPPPADLNLRAGLAAAAREPSGTVRVAYPDEPAAWFAAFHDDPASVDLAALWGLPLYRYDDAGQPRAALAVGATVVAGEGSWSVDIALAPGSWSDGVPVTADDVVATIGALRDTPRAAEFAPLQQASAIDDGHVRLTFAEPYLRWQHLLAGGLLVLPAHVIASDGIAAYRSGVPVSGGPFTLVSHEVGLRADFVANPDSPLGAPASERLEVLFTPSYETALGLLVDDRADVALGYLALNPVGRAEALDGIAGAAPLGGTWVGLAFRADGAYGGPTRSDRRARLVRSLQIEPLVEGLLQEGGAVADGDVPGPAGGVAPDDGLEDLAGLPDPTLLVPTWQESTGFAARAIQRAVTARNGDVVLARYEPDDLYRVAATVGDAALVVRRDGPRPSLASRVVWSSEELTGIVGPADAEFRRDGPANVAAAALLSADLAIAPLYRVGVAHAWRASLTGLRASSWAGLAFWDVGSWQVGAPAGG